MKRPAWLSNKIRKNKKPKVTVIQDAFKSQLISNTVVRVERGKQRPSGKVKTLLERFKVDLQKNKSVDVSLDIFFQLREAADAAGIVANYPDRRAMRLLTFSPGTETFNIEELPPKIKELAFPFQIAGIKAAIERYDGRCMIGDEMGLGKTVQAIAVAWHYKALWPVAVFCPSFLKLNWRKEFTFWTSLAESDICIIKNGKSVIPDDAKVVVFSYGLIASMLSSLKHKRFDVVICDEAHYLKSRRSNRAKAALELLKKSKKVLLLTGTPSPNRPEELFTLLSALRPCFAGSYTHFTTRYCDRKQGFFGVDVSGATNKEELSFLLKKACMIRRLKDDVLKDLPSKMRSQVLVELSNKEMKPMKEPTARLAAINQKIFSLKPGSEEARLLDFERKALINQLFCLNDVAKSKVGCEVMLQALQEVNKLVIFGYHRSILNALEEKLKSKNVTYFRIDGSTPLEARQRGVERFQDPSKDCRVALLSLGAANSGLTLTAASHMLFVSLHWTPAELLQAEDRCHRIGQTSSVHVRYLIAQDTVDERMWSKINGKVETTTAVLDGSSATFEADETTFEREPEEEEAAVDTVAVEHGVESTGDVFHILETL
jgi:SWI/SNF-related matrix-associated actin-dependent regulator 1 of chromatin subfamily A